MGRYGTSTRAHAGAGEPRHGASGSVGLLERPDADIRGHGGARGDDTGFDYFSEAQRGPYGESDFSAEPCITAQDVRTALGEDTDTLLAQADVDVDELIRLINAETTMLPAIDVGAVDGERGETPTAAVAAEPDDERTVLGASAKRWKRRFLKGAALSVLITLTGGGAAALAMDKNVTIEVDGNERTVHSFGDTVGEVLDDAGVQVGPHDALSPSPHASVGDGAVIHLERGRQLTVVVDGEERQAWVRATTVGEALSQLGMQDVLNAEGTELSTPASGHVPLDGMTLRIKTLKTITLFDGGNAPREVSTTALTAQALLEQRDMSLGADDEVLEGLDFGLSDGAEVHITRTGVTTVKKEETVEPPVEEVDDPEMMSGKQVVEEEGTPGKERVTYQVTRRNGEVVDRAEVDSEMLTEPEPKVVRVGTKQPEVPDGAVWDRLAQCESGGDWQINTGNGFYGGLQFNKGTWDSYGGDEYAAYPHEATRAEQIAIATKVRDDRGGYGAWPSCASQLGLPK